MSEAEFARSQDHVSALVTAALADDPNLLGATARSTLDDDHPVPTLALVTLADLSANLIKMVAEAHDEDPRTLWASYLQDRAAT